jgi:hypothetical protein
MLFGRLGKAFGKMGAPAGAGEGGGPSYTGPGDVLSGALAYIGTRAYSAANIGESAIELRESGGDTLQTFTWQSDGGLDLAAIATFKGANNLFVRRVFDHVVAGTDHWIQATNANQPAFLLNQLNSQPAIGFTAGSSQFLKKTNTVTQALPISVLAVAKETALGGQATIIGQDGADGLLLMFANNLARLYSAGGPLDVAAATNTFHRIHGVVTAGASDTLDVDAGAASATGQAGNQALAGERFTVGQGLGAIYLTGQIAEAAVYPVDFTASITALAANEATWWAL